MSRGGRFLRAAGGARRSHRLPELPRRGGTWSPRPGCPAAALASFLFSKCISRPEPQPVLPVPAGLSLRGRSAPEDEEEERRGGLRVQAPAAIRREVAGPLAARGNAGLGPGSWMCCGRRGSRGGWTLVCGLLQCVMTPEREQLGITGNGGGFPGIRNRYWLCPMAVLLGSLVCFVF